MESRWSMVETNLNGLDGATENIFDSFVVSYGVMRRTEKCIYKNFIGFVAASGHERVNLSTYIVGGASKKKYRFELLSISGMNYYNVWLELSAHSIEYLDDAVVVYTPCGFF